MGRTTAAAPGGGLASAPPARAAHRLSASDLDGPVARELADLVAPHIDSFDYFLESGLAKVVEGLAAVQLEHPATGVPTSFWFEAPEVGVPTRDDAPPGGPRLMPRDCREAGTTYKAPLTADLCWRTGTGPVQRLPRKLGGLPIMVKSRACGLRSARRAALVAAREESTEFGGYFICNGIERLLRLLIQPRRHALVGLKRGAYAKRGPGFSDTAVAVRCVRPDETSATLRIHYMVDGGARVGITVGRAEYFVPAGVLVRALTDASDRAVFDALVAPSPGGPAAASFVADRAEALLRGAAAAGVRTRAAAVEHLGAAFRDALGVPPAATHAAAGRLLLRDHVFVHLSPFGRVERARLDEQAAASAGAASTPVADPAAAPADPLDAAKADLLLACLRKLYALASGAAAPDDADAATAHEVLLPGTLLAKVAAERLADCLRAVRDGAARAAADGADPGDAATVKRAADRMPDVGRKVEYVLNTGNFSGRGALDLPQTTGFSVVAEKLNYARFLSHFRAVHRGAYFTELRTTAVRKLRPESWGFVCPVHTPDGAPCGLLTHLAAACRIVPGGEGHAGVTTAALAALARAGVLPVAPGAAGAAPPAGPPHHLEVHCDGRVVGWLPLARAEAAAAALRAEKAAALAVEAGGGQPSPDAFPSHAEVALVPPSRGGPFPGLFVFTGPGRMARPVLGLDPDTGAPDGTTQLIGTLEQAFLAIRCPDGARAPPPGAPRCAHAEPGPTAMLSVLARWTPFSDRNQSPRNMYQCQMAKQTMGTPALALAHRTDGKLYRLHTPQTPLARTDAHAPYGGDEYPAGTNAIVAVLAYTGYDMEDAMILNAASLHRGFAAGSVIKTEVLDAGPSGAGGGGRSAGPATVFRAEPAAAAAGRAPPPSETAFGQTLPAHRPWADAPPPAHADADRIDADGLPAVGAVLYPGASYACRVDTDTAKPKVARVKGDEVAIVDRVTVVGGGPRCPGPARAAVTMRISRNPVVGDKFSSRHGQKGVLSRAWPDADLPFVEATGMRPDLIINPHAFPSRMTVGMLVESVAAKAAALTGTFADATPFAACADGADAQDDAVTAFADALEAKGFSRLGGETMISGVTGEKFAADIFVGPVYYQRLRHMVSDKFQVRSVGPVNALTRQPVKGRKAGGGVRFGEMERDALLAHGAAALLHDRLAACSDASVADVCGGCGSVLAPTPLKRAGGGLAAQLDAGRRGSARPRVVCRACGPAAPVRRVALPHVFRYLAAELAAMNIKTTLDLSV